MMARPFLIKSQRGGYSPKQPRELDDRRALSRGKDRQRADSALRRKRIAAGDRKRKAPSPATPHPTWPELGQERYRVSAKRGYGKKGAALPENWSFVAARSICQKCWVKGRGVPSRKQPPSRSPRGRSSWSICPGRHCVKRLLDAF